jgi:hypothetical protein
MKKKQKGMGELLALIKTRPELVTALVFDPASVKRLLRSKAARRLVLGVNVRAFLRYVAGPKDGGPIVICRRTAAPCKVTFVCPGGTKPPCPHPPITCSGTSR